MLTQTDVCNMALSLIGKGRIVSVDDQNENARQCKLFYDVARQELLRHYNWGFARRVIELAQLDTTHPEWRYVYAYPAQCLRINKIFNDTIEIPFTDERNFCVKPRLRSGLHKDKYTLFLTSSNTQAIGCDVNKAWADFNYNVTDVEMFSGDFLQAFVHTLASNIAQQLTGNQQLVTSHLQLAAQYLANARYTTAIEKHEKPEFPDAYVKARW